MMQHLKKWSGNIPQNQTVRNIVWRKQKHCYVLLRPRTWTNFTEWQRPDSWILSSRSTTRNKSWRVTTNERGRVNPASEEDHQDSTRTPRSETDAAVCRA